jgi:ribose transport system permease protein
MLVAGQPIWLSILAALLVGAVVGLVNGVIIVYGGIPPLIVTLGMLYAIQGLVVVITKGAPILPFPPEFNAIGQGFSLGIPNLIFVAVVVGIIGHVALEYSKFGYHVRATGGNLAAAKATGLRTNFITLTVYIVSGVSAALAGVLLASQLGSGQSAVGASTMLAVIAAVIIGGTSLFGGVGNIPGTLLGALLLSTISSGLNAIAVNPALQQVIVGIVIVAAVGIDRVRRARAFRKAKT